MKTGRKSTISDSDPPASASELREREIEEAPLLHPIVVPEDRDSNGTGSSNRPPLQKASSFSDLPTYRQGMIEIRVPKVRHSFFFF
jgi:hypothetical protein